MARLLRRNKSACVRVLKFSCTYNNIQMDGIQMDNSPRIAGTEKITINLGFVDLGQIDLIVSDGFYSNRTDFVRTAIRNQLDKHADVLKQSIRRKRFDLGLHDYTVEYLEMLHKSGRTIDIRVIGLARISADVSADLARSTIASISVLGALQASVAVKSALADRVF
jgi:Arc/MetJ-type ribon-helix-helix transcriptional regulator